MATSSQNVDLLLNRISGLTRAFLSAAKTEEHQQAVVSALNSAYLSLGQEVTESTGMGCPGGWVACPNGSCVRDGEDCSGIGG